MMRRDPIILLAAPICLALLGLLTLGACQPAEPLEATYYYLPG